MDSSERRLASRGKAHCAQPPSCKNSDEIIKSNKVNILDVKGKYEGNVLHTLIDLSDFDGSLVEKALEKDKKLAQSVDSNGKTPVDLLLENSSNVTKEKLAPFIKTGSLTNENLKKIADKIYGKGADKATKLLDFNS